MIECDGGGKLFVNAALTEFNGRQAPSEGMLRMSRVIVVKATYDDEAGVWFTESADIHGLRIEAVTLEALIQRIPGAVQDLLEADGDGDLDCEIPIELIAHASTRTRVRLASAA